MSTQLLNRDIAAPRQEYYFAPPKLLQPLFKDALLDSRDLPMLYLFYNIFVVAIPGAMLTFYCNSHILGLSFFVANIMLFQERFLIGLHYHSHRAIFKNKLANAAMPLALCPFFGVPSGMYYLHHVVMHHVENNATGWDLSSTEAFQRDNVWHFLYYWLRFLFAVWFELPIYAARRGRVLLGFAVSCAMVLFWAVLCALYNHSPRGTFWLFLFPLLVNSFLLMFGNWCQHIFIHPNKEKSRSNFHLTYNVINDPCNQRAFNDGYHTEHHLNSRRHWSELPAHFMANIKSYADEDSLVFDAMDPMKVPPALYSCQ